MKASNIFPEYILGHPKDQDRKPHHALPKSDRKPRPAGRSIRDKLPLYGHLPRYSGPYTVGVIDLEIPVREPRSFSHIKRDHRHQLVLETVLFTIYYPAHLDAPFDDRAREAGKKHKLRPTWITRPRHETAEGYAKFASLPVWPTMAFFLSTSLLTKLPAYRNAQLAEHWPESNNENHIRGKQEGRAGPVPEAGPAKPCFPLILFSHGLGGTRTAYSSICGEFASHGFIVCAVEHRDGSGPRTIVNYPPGDSLRRVNSEASAKQKHGDSTARNKPYSKVDFIFPQSDKFDTTPGHEVDAELREAQIKLRCAEIDEAYHVMTKICSGHGEEFKDQNLRVKGTVGASSMGLDGVDFTQWKYRFHCDRVTMIGHSFGSATTVEMLRQSKDYNYITQGIVYDIWGSPVQEATEEHHISAPLLGINSEAFMYWDTNFRVAKSLIEESRDAGHPAWLMTCRGTVHISQSDFCILYPRIAEVVMKMTMDPVRAIDVNIDASLDFLSRTLHFDEEQAWRRNLPAKKLLDLEVTKTMPTEHKPNKKWVAVRLKVQHEGRKRMVPHAKKKYWEKLRKAGEEEVWVHIAPGKATAEDEDVDDDSAVEEEAEGSS